MCFKTTDSAKSKIAKTDIECYKVLWDDYTNLYKYVVPTVKYKKGKQMPTVFINKQFNDTASWYCKITSGYHSYRNMRNLIAGRRRYGEQNLIGTINVKCVIPKGTRYYENRTQYVSETIMML